MLEFLISGIAWAEAPKEELSEFKESSVVISQEKERSQKVETPFVSISHPDYSKYREQLAKIIPYGNHCALFVNRMIALRYGVGVYGDAWTMQLHPKNQEWFKLIWRLSEKDFNRSNMLNLHKKEDRIKHYETLYKVLGQQEDPQGVVGFTYRFSAHREKLSQSTVRETLAQTHVGYVGGKHSFSFKNDTDEAQSLQDLISKKHGTIHDFEKAFVESKVRLNTWLEPGDEYFYEDYQVEEYFKGVVNGSLLEVFLRKHRNNDFIYN